jgi:hypothetical protein
MTILDPYPVLVDPLNKECDIYLKIEPKLDAPIKVRFTITDQEIDQGTGLQEVDIDVNSLISPSQEPKIAFVSKETIIDFYPVSEDYLSTLRQRPPKIDNEGRLEDSDRPILSGMNKKSTC